MRILKRALALVVGGSTGQVILVQGPAGSGKTTAIRAIAGQLASKGTVLIIVNDDGDGTKASVDAGIIGNHPRIDLEVMTSGCVGCEDAAEFIEVVRDRISRYDVVIIEPKGYAAGNEIPEILSRAHMSFHCICVFSVPYLDDKKAAGTTESQLAAAANGVLLTKYRNADGSQHSEYDAALEYIGEHAPQGVATHEYAIGDQIPSAMLTGKVSCGRECYSHDHHDHDHGHEHVHHPGPAVYAFHKPIMGEVATTTLIELAKTVLREHNIFTVKIVAQSDHGQVFVRYADRTWADSVPSPALEPLLTIYAYRPIPEGFAQEFVDEERQMALHRTEQGDTKTLMQGAHATGIDGTRRFAKKLLDQMPRSVVFTENGQPVCYPDNLAQLMRQIRRPGMREDLLFTESIKACVYYWLTAAPEIEAAAEQWPVEAAKWRRYVGASLGYHAATYGNQLGPDLVAQIWEVQPATMLLAGLRGMSRLNSNDQLAIEFAGEVATVMSGDPSAEEIAGQILEEFGRMQRLALDRPQVIAAWTGAAHKFEEARARTSA